MSLAIFAMPSSPLARAVASRARSGKGGTYDDKQAAVPEAGASPASGMVPPAPVPPYPWARIAETHGHYWKCDACDANGVTDSPTIDAAVTHAQATGHTVRDVRIHEQVVTGVMI